MSDRLDDDESGEPIPEADALEQAAPVEPEPPEDEEIDLSEGVPDDAAEADALEQATPVPGQEEDDVPR
jgi:hypothetical protein